MTSVFSPGRLPLVGRDAELEIAHERLDEALAGQGRVLLVSGEPGIGKTRLVEELAAQAAEQGALVAWGRVDDVDGAPPYRPWIELLGVVLEGIDHDVARVAIGANGGALAAILPAVERFVDELEPPPRLDPAAARFRLHDAIADLLVACSVQHPLVLVLDDAHWADVASLELVRLLARRVPGTAVLLVVTYRSVDAGDSGLLEDVLASLARHPALERIALEGLSEAEVGRFMAQTIGLRPRRGAVAEVHDRTEGNPFFVGELARLLESEGRLGGDVGGATVPVGVRDVVRRRLAQMPAATRDVLVVAAVLGREFDVATLAACADLAEIAVVDAVEPALAAGLVIETTTGIGQLRFSHALVRDTVYGEVRALRRATLHARAGEVLERLGGSDGARVEEIARHFVHAAAVAGPASGVRWSLAAAVAAQAALAYEQAEERLRTALDLVALMADEPERWQSELRVQNRLVALLLQTRGQGAPQFGEACARARELCERVGGSDELFTTMFGLALFQLTQGEYRLLRELAAQMLAVGTLHDGTPWLLAGQWSVGVAELHAGGIVAAHAAFAEAERLGRTLDPSSPVIELFGVHPLAITLPTGALTAWLLGDDEQADALIDEAVALATSLGHPMTLADVLYSCNKLAVLRGDVAGALGGAEQALAHCDAHGCEMFKAWLRMHRGWALCHGDRHDEGVAEMTIAIAASRTGGGRLNASFFLGLLADGEAQCGDRERALALVDEALALTHASEGKLYEADLHRRRGELLAAAGPAFAGDAERALRSAVAIADAQGAVTFKRRAEAALERLGCPSAVVAARPRVADDHGLSARERELLGLVADGLTDKEIAAQLVISLATVRSHLDRIRDKTDRRRRPELTRLAIDLGLSQA